MSEQQSAQYFDLIVEGIGYLDRIRQIQPQQGQPFWVCSLSALRGEAGRVVYTWFDCRVSGKAVQETVRLLESYVLRGSKVLVGFRLGDLHAEAFTFAKGQRQGSPGANLRARLLSFKFVKVDGVEIQLGAPAPAPEKPRARSRAAA